MSANDWLTSYTKEVDETIMAYLPAEEGHQKTVLSAMNYSVKAGGKRLRPLFMREIYRMFGGRGREVEPFMAAIEMIHTFSLIHDDLPCMDNDEYRRGRPTTWVAYGYDMAVLAGDGLAIYAFETAAKAFAMAARSGSGIPAAVPGQSEVSALLHGQKETGFRQAAVARCIGLLAEKSGIYGMIGGQTADVELTGKPLSREQLDFIYRLKTGALLEAPMMIGAILAGADEEQVRTVERMAACVGKAFQIQDDILDLTSSQEVLGKPVLSDERNQKTTYVSLYGMEQARKDVAALSQEAIDILEGLPGDHEIVRQLILMLITREK